MSGSGHGIELGNHTLYLLVRSMLQVFECLAVVHEASTHDTGDNQADGATEDAGDDSIESCGGFFIFANGFIVGYRDANIG